MIAGIFHEGSGLGNQLHRYVMTRVLAEDLGYDYGMETPWNFKGNSFMEIDTGSPVSGLIYSFQEGMKNGMIDYDWKIKSIKDDTKIDGEFQGEKYFIHHLNDMRDWMKVKILEMPSDVCVINFRGGEYKHFRELFLTPSYWLKGIEEMQKINPNMKFEVHTDDVDEARKFFPNYRITHDIGLNWRSIRYAKYLLLSNSSFAILPALMNKNVKKIIAPWGWARHNEGRWCLPYNKYTGWTYIK